MFRRSRTPSNEDGTASTLSTAAPLRGALAASTANGERTLPPRRPFDGSVELRRSGRDPASTAAAMGTERPAGRGSRRPARVRPPPGARSRYGAVRILTVAFYVVSWVANGEVLQGLSDGTLATQLFGENNADGNDGAYNQPGFVTWYSYNSMMLSWCVVLWCLPSSPSPMSPAIDVPLSSRTARYVVRQWAGCMGVSTAIAACTVVGLMLQLLNITFIVGLNCVSVSLANAVYQLQTVIVVVLSVVLLGDRFEKFQATGILVSTVGVVLVVVPPVLQDSESTTETSEPTLCPTVTIFGIIARPVFVGIVSILISASIGALYYLSWRVFEERRTGKAESDHNRTRVQHATSPSSLSACPSQRSHASPDGAFSHDSSPSGDGSDRHTIQSEKLRGFLDTNTTLAMIGTCNLFFGWPLPILLHVTGMQAFVPPTDWIQWTCLNVSSMVEFAFDASCALSIYMTSPLVASIVAPLTLPVSILADRLLRSSSQLEFGWTTSLGTALILMGVILLEMSTDSILGWLANLTQAVRRVLRQSKREASSPLMATETGEVV